MVAATILTAANSQTHIAGMEIVVLTASDDETYDSKRFAKITGAIATTNDDVSSQATETAVAFSGKTATLHNSNLSDTTVTLLLFGRN